VSERLRELETGLLNDLMLGEKEPLDIKLKPITFQIASFDDRVQI